MASSKYPIPTQLFIKDKLVDSHSPERYSLYNPVDESLFCDKVQYAAAEDVEAAVEAAVAAFNGPWRTYSGAQRGEVLQKLAVLLEEYKEELGWLDGTPIGKPVSAATMEIEFGASILRYYAGWTDKYAGESFPADDGFVKIVRHEPLGVTVGINPWNGPIGTLCLKLGPALATGNVMIIKPSEKTPFGTVRFAELATRAGIVPPGVIQALPGAGATGALLSSHMKVRKVSFTGSVATGRRIQQAASNSNMKRVTLELGGKSPSAVFDDCNFENAVFWSTLAITQNSGQACFAASRLFVQESIADKFIAAFAQAMKEASNKLGDPTKPETQLGPLADSSQFARVSSFFQQDAGQTKVLVGGKQHGERGFYWEPTILLNPKEDALVYREEIFGPVVCVKTFKDEADFIRMANDTEFGLMAGVFTQDINRAMRLSAELDSGVVGINCVSYINIQAPFGGTKQSGVGREMGHYALRCFTEPKTVLIK
ncbi:aldehyde dehydrogenase domain-containing protein [Aspergillus sergii]|uniref:aldehyde dehydrogenase (NAD(+)) n=1 Tax=Aspergillus sergii TaxID=1034303 RepID=A0A5N6XDT6_9EURO|nr:aldehyde dehydrogenase domain-containing protein [Aspergillus sergii]